MSAYNPLTQITPIFNPEYDPNVYGTDGLSLSEADDRYLKLTGGTETGIVEFIQGLETNEIDPLSTGASLSFSTTGQTNFNGNVNVSSGHNYLVNGAALVPSQTSQSGKYLSTNGSNTSWSALQPAGGPAQIQYNNGSTFAASSNLLFLSGTNTLAVNGTVNTSLGYLVNSIPLVASQSGNSGKFLTTDGNQTSWGVPVEAAGGSNTQIQYNNNDVLAGSANMTFTNSNTLSIANQLSVLDTSAGTNSLNLQQVSNQSYLNWGASNNLNFTTGTSPALLRGFWSGSTGQLTLYNGLSISGSTQFNSSFNSNGISNSGQINSDNLQINQKIIVGSMQPTYIPFWNRGGTITMFRGIANNASTTFPLPVLNGTGFICGSIYNSVGNWMSFTGSCRGSVGVNIQQNGSNPSVSSISWTLNGVQQTGLRFSGDALNTNCNYCIYLFSDAFNG